MTDCFQDAERTNKITYETIKLLNEKRIHYLIVTKNGDLISNDEYIKVMDKELAHIQVSITNTDEKLGKKIEPGAPSYIERIKGVEKLQENGFDVSVRLSPYIPEFVNIDEKSLSYSSLSSASLSKNNLSTFCARLYSFFNFPK